MTARPARVADFIIGGTEKAGTTSVFDWLSAHPQVAAAARKETDFFRELYCGDREADLQRYAGFFAHCDRSRPVFMEASTGYLGEAATVAPRMAALVPQTRILFILRDPVERIHSSFQFHRGRLDLPAGLSFADYVERCLAYERRQRSPAELGLDEWYLKVLRFGRYAERLAIFREHLPAARIEVMFFEALGRDPAAFMRDLSVLLAIDAGFWDSFDFRPSNVTFAGRNQALHRVAVQINRRSEVVLRRVPGLKRSAVRLYKALNQSRERPPPMPAAVRSRLVDYYAPSIDALARQIGDSKLEAWARPLLGTEAA
jgi:hypothetical protein